MKEFAGQFIIEFLLEYPGAFVRWLFFFKKHSFEEVLSSMWNYVISIIILFLIVFCFWKFNSI